jgi:uridylate kinase
MTSLEHYKSRKNKIKIMKIVIKLGGSISIGRAGPNYSYFSKLIPVINSLKKKNQIIIAVGGGQLTRAYGKSIEKFGLDNDEKEKIFIQLIKANVLFASAVLKMNFIQSLNDIKETTSGIIGGVEPGRSTDANAALAARKINADIFIKLTDVDGIYTRDPKKFRGAKKIGSMMFNELRKFSTPGRPNSYGILDSMAIKTLSASRIKTVVMNGKKPKSILAVLQGKPIGTVVS